MQLGTTEIAVVAVLAALLLSAWGAKRLLMRLLANAVHRELKRMSFRWSRSHGGVVLVKGARSSAEDKIDAGAGIAGDKASGAKAARGVRPRGEPVSDTAKTTVYHRSSACASELDGATRAVTAEQLAMLVEAEG